MRYLLLSILIFAPSFAFAVSGYDSRFDFTVGQPGVVADTTDACTNQAVARFDFSVGQPGVVYDLTAVCTAEAPPAAPTTADPGVYFFE